MVSMSERGTSARSVEGRKKQAAARGSRLALYRKYRPETLDQIVGQPQVTDVLKKATASGNFAHAYLFTGQRGTGKTSAARILAHLVNQTDYNSDDIDIIEIDAASRGSVDDARELREKAFLAPIAASHKIYIIDEVHMLSTAAFNALLKIIEEPPEHIVFIMATTELQKVPATILSRVQRFHFKSVSPDVVAAHLGQIAQDEGLKAEPAALELIARHGGGSFRDSITLLDQLSGTGTITADSVEDILGLASDVQVQALVEAISSHDIKTIVQTVGDLLANGVGPSSITHQLIDKLLTMAPAKPKLYPLVESLLEVNKSAAPDIKLLAILATAAAKSPHTVLATAATSPADTKLATIIEQKIQRESKLVSESKSSQPKSIEPKLENPTSSKPVDQPTVSSVASPASVDWQDVLGELKNLDRPAALATLKFATIEYENDTLTLYFERAFHRKKADAAHCRESLQLACANLYQATPRVIVAPTAQAAADSKDSLVAGVAAIMGGGSIVKET